MRYIYGLVIMSTLLLCGCVREQVGGDDIAMGNVDQSLPELTASISDTQTKTYVENSKHLRWHASDQISAFVGSNLNSRYEFAGKTGDNSGSFSPIETFGENGSILDRIYAVYPFSESNAVSSEGEFAVVLPETQAYANDSFGAGANVMVAVTEGTDDTYLSFKNACGYLKLNLCNPGNAILKSVTVRGNAGERIAGAAVVKMVSGVPEVLISDDASEEITIDCGNGVDLGTDAESATPLWLVIPPTVFSKGITITATGDLGAVFTKSTSKEIVITRNEIQPMAALEVELTPVLPDLNEIFYTATEKVEPTWSGANESVVSHEFNEETGKGVITFSETLTKIPSSAFSGKTSLVSVALPKCVKEIASKAFYNCSNLEKFTLSSQVDVVGTDAFVNCTGELFILDNIPSKSGSNYLFKGSKFTKVIVDDAVEFIGDGAFYGCASLTDADLSGVDSLGGGVFQSCSALQNVTLSENLTEIPSSMFYGCSSLTTIDIPSTVMSIGNNAFNGCKLLSVINLPEGLETIGTSAFSSCRALTEVYLPSSLKSLGSGVFSYCSGITTFTGNYATEDSRALMAGGELLQYAVGCSLTSYSVPEGITTINSAFYGAKFLESVELPSTLKTLRDDFGECANLREFKLKSTEPPFIGISPWNPLRGKFQQILVPIQSVEKYKAADNWKLYSTCIAGYYMDISGVEISSDKIIYTASEKIEPNVIAGFGANYVTNVFDETTGVGEICFDGQINIIPYCAFYDKDLITSVTIPNCVQSIGISAFSGCGKLENVQIPSSMKTIGESAFSGCSSIKRIYLPEGVTKIERYSFDSCTSLQTIDLPSTLTSVGYMAFWGDKELSSVYCNAANPPSGSNYMFDDNYKTYTIYVPLESVAAYKGANYWKNYADHIVGVLGNDTPLGVTVRLQTNDSQYGWVKSTTVSNPSSSEYSGVYESNNWHKHGSAAVMHIDINGLTSFEFYIRSNSDEEEDYDYMMVSQLDQSINHDTKYSDSTVKAYTYGTSKSGTTIDDYTKVTFDNIDGRPHRITILYRKDGSDNDGDDRGYVLIPKGQGGYEIEEDEGEIVFQGTYKLTLSPSTYAWQKSSVINPDSNLYDGVYESSNYKQNDSESKMYIDISGYDTFTFYIRSYAESNYDYVMVSQLDKNISRTTSYSNTTYVKAHTRGSQNSGTSISSYKAVTFTGIGGGDHRITVLYRKDDSDYSGTDRGYVLIPKNQ